MSQSIINTQQLKNFISTFDLMDKHSRVIFNADIEIITASSKLNIYDQILITFAGYDNCGKLSIMEKNNSIDAKLFPFVFEAQYGTFNFVNSEYLLIVDNHTKNSIIGKYEVIIKPKI